MLGFHSVGFLEARASLMHSNCNDLTSAGCKGHSSIVMGSRLSTTNAISHTTPRWRSTASRVSWARRTRGASCAKTAAGSDAHWIVVMTITTACIIQAKHSRSMFFVCLFFALQKTRTVERSTTGITTARACSATRNPTSFPSIMINTSARMLWNFPQERLLSVVASTLENMPWLVFFVTYEYKL